LQEKWSLNDADELVDEVSDFQSQKHVIAKLQGPGWTELHFLGKLRG
jgi:hypothetical protein